MDSRVAAHQDARNVLFLLSFSLVLITRPPEWKKYAFFEWLRVFLDNDQANSTPESMKSPVHLQSCLEEYNIPFQ